MQRQCLACGQRPAATTPEWPALCHPCLDSAGERIEPGARVVCTVDAGCSGVVERLEEDGHIAVVRTASGPDAWVSVGDMVRVAGR